MEAESIRFKERRSGYKIRRRLIDPNFGRKIYGNTNNMVKDEYRLAGTRIRHPLIFHEAIDDIASGHAAVKELLYFDKAEPITADNHPKLYVYNTCKETINSFLHYMYKQKRGEDPSMHLEGKPAEEYKHFMDVVRYYAVQRFKWVNTREEIILPYEERRGVVARGKGTKSAKYS